MVTNIHFDILMQHQTFRFMHNYFENSIKDHKNYFNIVLTTLLFEVLKKFFGAVGVMISI